MVTRFYLNIFFSVVAAGLLFSNVVNAQTYNMGSGTINTCSGTYYDPAGTGNYANNANYTQTICSNNGLPVFLTFSSFNLESGWDYLSIYNGPNTSSPLIGTYSGSSLPGGGTIQGTGTCITLVFTSDGSVTYSGWVAAIGCGAAPPPPPPPYVTACNSGSPFCTGTTYTFQNSTSVPSYGGGGVFGCLGSTPNPAWYYLQLQSGGNMNISISQVNTSGSPIDVDFVLWGPFTSLATGCPAISSTNIESCSYSGSATETATITGGVAGEVYILLLTNFSNQAGTITFNQSSGSATTNCNILCNITGMTAMPGACNGATNTFNLTGTLQTFAPPTTGTLNITTSCGGSTTLNPPFGTSLTYTVANIPAGSGACTVTATYSADPTCTYTVAFMSPPSCVTCNATATNTGPYCPGQTIQLNATGGGTYSWSGPGGWTSNVQNPTRPAATTAMSGIYTVTVTNGSATCTATTSVTVNPTPTVTASNTGPYCPGSTIQLNTSAGTGYQWAGPLGFNSISQNPTISNASTTMSGVYSVTVNVGGCFASATTTVTVNPTPTVNANNGGPYCPGDNISLTSSGGGTYNWSGPGTYTSTAQNPVIASATTAMSGVYSVTATVNGCTAAASTTVTVNPSPIATASNSGPYCPGTTIQLTGGGGTSYSWNGPQGYSSAAQSPAIPNSTLAMDGVYTLTVTALGCTSTATTSVTVANNFVPSVSSNSPVCEGGTLNLSAANGAQWQWSGPNGFTSTLQNPVVSPVALADSGVYSALITDAAGCTGTATLTVTINPLPVPVLTTNSPVCPGDTIKFFCSNGVSWNWNGPNGFTSSAQSAEVLNAQSTAVGPYSVSITDANGCTGTGTINASLHSLPGITTVSDTICVNGTATISASGATSYSWSSGTTPSAGATVNASPLTTTTFTVTGTDANGCENSAQATVTVNQLPPVTVNSPTVCPGATANLTAAGAISYSWSAGTTPSAGANVSVTTPVTAQYTVTGTDNNGCSSTAVSTVTINATFAVDAGADDTVCLGDQFTLTATAPSGTNFTWSTGASGATISGTASATATYYVVGTDAIGCMSGDSVTVIVPPQMSLSAGGFAATCNGVCDGQAVVLVNPNIGPFANYTYYWSSGDSSAAANNLCAGTYSVVVFDAAGCFDTTSVTVTQPTAIVATASNNTPASCNGACDGGVNISASGGTGAFGYSWSSLGSGSAPSNLCAGSYTCTVTDANNCSVQVPVVITQPAAISVSINPVNTICIGQTASLSAVANGGNGGYTYNWSAGTTPNNQAAVSVNPTVTSSYTVTVTDVNSCPTAVATITVTVNPPLTVVASADDTICAGESATLTSVAAGGNGIYSYTWTPSVAPGNQSTQTVSPTATTAYTVTVTDACGTPSASDNVVVVVNQLPVLNISTSDPNGCAPWCVTFTGTSVPASTSCTWSFTDGQTVSNDCAPVVCFAAAGTYGATLSVVDVNGCANTISSANLVDVHPVPAADFSWNPQPASEANPVIDFTDSTTNATIVSWDWSFGDPLDNSSSLQNPTFTYLNAGSYNVMLTVISDNGCVDSVEHTIVIDPEFLFYIPNAFSPNGDGLNDGFSPSGIGVDVENFEIWIYDRWGNMIWYNTDLTKQWDGKAEGRDEIVQQDVYIWKIRLKDFKGERKSYVGHVTVVK